jgi:Uma2 family endonuclease
MYAANAFLQLPLWPPCTVVVNPPIGDDDFEILSEQTEFAVIERLSDGTILVSEHSGSMTSSASSEISCQFSEWSKPHGGGHVLPHCGFFLPDGSCLSPDCAYVANEQLAPLSREERGHFLRFAPLFLIELQTQSEPLGSLMRKMESWIANGVQLGWLVDPYARQVHVYAPGVEPRVEMGTSVAGSGPVEGFVLDLTEVWSCYE